MTVLQSILFWVVSCLICFVWGWMEGCEFHHEMDRKRDRWRAGIVDEED